MKIFLILTFLTVLGGFLRLSNLDKNPVSLNVDEVSVGYNAYSILKTARDEYGNFLPLSFKSLGDYKPPVYFYLVVPSIAVFGLNEFAIRFPSAFIATLSIPLWFIFYRKLTKSDTYALAGTALFSISPWDIYHSRFALETPLASTMVVLGVYSFLKLMEKGRFWWIFLSALSLALSMYTYQTERLFTPLLILVLLVYNRSKLFFKGRDYLKSFILLFVVFITPFVINLIFSQDTIRAKMLFISKDIEYQRYVLIPPVFEFQGMPKITQQIFDNSFFLLIFYWVFKLLNYISIPFLFYNGLAMTAENTYGVGLLYLFEMPLLFYGVFCLIKKKLLDRYLLIWWLLLGLFPASITLGDLSSRRVLIESPIILLICAIGLVNLYRLVNLNASLVKKVVIYSIFGLFASWNLVLVFLVFSAHFPIEKAEDFMWGSKEVVSYVLENQEKYQEIIFDPARGIDGPNITSVPYLYLLFYSKFDPGLYQQVEKRNSSSSFSFQKYTFRHIEWGLDRSSVKTLLVGSPWSLPLADLSPGQIKKKIYLPNGELALLIVSSDQ